MNKAKFTEQLKKISTVYFKELNEEYTRLAYEYLKDYKPEVFEQAIKNIILKNKYMPTISELIDECNNCSSNSKDSILSYMMECNYFKDIREYEKALHFVSEGIIPEWLKQDMFKYYNQMNSQKLSNTQAKMIG